MPKFTTVVLLLLAIASLFFFNQAAVQAKSNTEIDADLCIDRIWLDASGYINVALRNCGKEKIAPSKLFKAKLLIDVNKSNQAILLHKIDPKGRLANPGGKLTYRVPEKIKNRVKVTATIYVAKGLFDESNTKNNIRTATLSPPLSTPSPAAQAKPTVQAVKPPAAKPTPQISRLRITGLSLTNNYVVVEIRHLDKTKIDPASLGKARLMVIYQGKSNVYPLSRVDPGARRLNGAKREVSYRTGVALAKRGVVLASIQGLGAQPTYQATLAPVIIKPAVKPTAELHAVAKPTTQVKPTPAPAVVRIKDITLVGGTVRVTLERLGAVKVSTKALSQARLTVFADGKQHNYNLHKADPAGSKLNSSQKKVVFNTGIELEKTASIRAQLSGIGATSVKTAQLMVKPTPKPVVQPATSIPTKPTVQVKPTPVPAVVRIKDITLVGGTVRVTLERLGAVKVSTKALSQARLTVFADGKQHNYNLHKADPAGSKLNSSQKKVVFNTGIELEKTASIRAQLSGIGATSVKTAQLMVKPTPKPVLQPATSIPTKPTVQVKPTPVPAVVRVKDIALVDRTVRVTLERWSAAEVPASALSRARLTVIADGESHSFDLGKVDPKGRRLNSSQKKVVFNTGIELEKTASIRAQLSGIGATSAKTAQLMVKPTPKPVVKPTAAAETTQAKITIWPQSIAITQGKDTQVNLRGAQTARVAKVHILHGGKAVEGLSASLAEDKLQIDSNSQKLPSGQYELVLLDKANNEIQRLPLGLSFSQSAPVRLGGGVSADRVISGQMTAGWNQQELADNWVRDMYQAGLLQVSISPNAGQFSIRSDNYLRWCQLPPGRYTITVTAPSMWSISGGQQTILAEEQYSHLSSITVTPRYRIHGTVNDCEDPAQGVSQVRVQRLNSAGIGGAVRAVSVDQSGNYSVIVDAGRYKVKPLVPQNSGLPQPVERIVTVPYGSRQELQVDFDLSRDLQTRATPTPDSRPMDSRPIVGVVRLADGSGADDVTIEIRGIDHPNLRTDENGEFQTQGIRQNVYVTIRPRKDGWDFSPRRAVASASDGHIVEIEATPTHLARFVINGTIQADGRPLAGVTVHCGDQTTTTAQSGVFAFRDLPQGQYVVRPELEGYSFEPAALNITINDRNMLNHYFVASRIAPTGNSFIAGNLWSVTYSGGLGHEGLGDKQVKLFYCTGGNDPNCSARVVVPGHLAAVTEDDGHFVFQGLGQGRYVLVPQSVHTAFQPAERIVNLSGQSVSGVDFVRASGDYNAQSINGRFSTLDDSPIPDGITLRVESCDHVQDPTCQRTNAQVRINPDGSFIIWDVPPGVVKLVPMGADLTFEPASMLMTNRADSTNFGGRYIVRRDVGHSSVGNLTIRLGRSRDMEDRPQVVWQVEYLGQSDMTEYARQRPQDYQAQSQRQVASDPVTGVSHLNQVSTGTYKIYPSSIHPRGECEISPEVTYIFVSPGENTMRASVIPVH